MKTTLFLLCFFLFACNGNRKPSPDIKRYIGHVSDDEGNMLEDSVYIEASKDTLYLRVYRDGSFDRPKLPLDQGKAQEDATDADFIMYYFTQITGPWEDQKPYLVRNNGTAYKRKTQSPATTNESVSEIGQAPEQEISDQPQQTIVINSPGNIRNVAEEKPSYRVTWTSSQGARAFRCERSSSSSTGEACFEIGSLGAYRDAKGAILWNRSFAIGAILWTDKKVIYQGYEGTDHGTSDFWIIRDEDEFIQYCQAYGNSVQIITNKQTYTRN